MIAAGSLIWNLIQSAEEARSIANQAARALLEKDFLYREWSLLHGGVYVPDSDAATAALGPGIHDHEVITRSGQKLVLLNPALVSRQIFDVQDQRFGIRGHLTSLKPLRSSNLPDAWETVALESFETGVKEASVTETRQGERYFRIMRPLFVTASCLRCHEEAGHKVGEVRGGISLTLPLSRFAQPSEKTRLAVAHVVMWMLGLAGLFFTSISLRRHLRARQQAETERESLIFELKDALLNVKELRGLIPICTACKKIRNDQGYWTQLETYLREHTDAEFSHGLCVDCLRKLYPDVSSEVEARIAKQKPPTSDDQRAAPS
jgi:hypothetical protein